MLARDSQINTSRDPIGRSHCLLGPRRRQIDSNVAPNTNAENCGAHHKRHGIYRFGANARGLSRSGPSNPRCPTKAASTPAKMAPGAAFAPQPCMQSSIQLAFVGQGSTSAKVAIKELRLLSQGGETLSTRFDNQQSGTKAATNHGMRRLRPTWISRLPTRFRHQTGAL